MGGFFISKNNSNERKPMKIWSIQANSLWKVNNGDENAYLDLKDAVINDSLFLHYMKQHGVVNKNSKNRDFIVMKFEYGVKETLNHPKIDSQDLRKLYYKNGAEVTWKKHDKNTGETITEETIVYKMLMRNPGKAKKGDCIFVRDSLHNVALNYLTMELFNKMPDFGAKIVEMSAYSTLTTATALDYIRIPLKNILIVQDETVTTVTNAVAVKARDVKHEKEIIDYDATENLINELGYTFYKKKQKQYPQLKCVKKTLKELRNCGLEYGDLPKKISEYTKKECYVDRSQEKMKVSNILWDGMGLIDNSIFPEDKGMEGFVYCRSHFFKSCLFSGDIQQYFKDYYGADYETATVEDMFGNPFLVKDVKVVITNNSIKWLKFSDLMGSTPKEAYCYYEKIMKKYNYEFAIVKTAHSSKWGDMQRSSFQINNSLPCTKVEVLENIAKDSVDYCNALKTDHDAFIKHLEMTGSQRYSINNVLIALDKWNNNFKYTRYFKSNKSNIISKFKKERLKLGKLLQYGDNLTICGNPIALLMKVTGQDFRNEDCFETCDNGIQCYTARFKDGEKIAGFRSPHNSPNNIVQLINVYPKSIRTYFKDLGNNVIIINGIGTDVQSRLNGQDLDTDSIYATNQPDIVKIAEYAYENYPTIINDIPLENNSIYSKDMESYAEMDNKISSAQFAIGRASNIAQLALSYYYDRNSESKELEDVFIMCSVIAQVCIDSAKRSFVINENSEINRISNLDCMKCKDGKIYPRFYADVQEKLKGYDIEKSCIGKFDCPMEILYDIIENKVIDLRKFKEYEIPTYDLNTVFKYKTSKKRDSKQYKKIIKIVEEYDEKVNKLNKRDEDYSQNVLMEFESCMDKIKKLKINEYTMSSLIAYAFLSKRDVNICNRLLTVLYDSNPELFLSCFIKSNENEKTPDKIA